MHSQTSITDNAYSSALRPSQGSAGRNSMLEAALGYARANLPVFPCQPHKKAPAVRNGYKAATTDQKVITAWWGRSPNANIAMPTGRHTFDVLDIDVRPNGSGLAALSRLDNAGLLRCALRRIRTPSGGWHIYFLGSEQGCRSLPDYFVDFKSNGGYVLLPPSSSGEATYGVANHCIADQAAGLRWQDVLTTLAVPTSPVGVAAVAVRPEYYTLGRLATWLSRQGEGNRNKALYWACGQAARHGATALDDIAALTDTALGAGLPYDEVIQTAQSALLRHRFQRQPRDVKGTTR